MSNKLPFVHSPNSAVRPGCPAKELDPDNAFDNAFKMVSIFDVVVIFVRLFSAMNADIGTSPDSIC